MNDEREHEGLSRDEREHLRARLVAFMRSHPARAPFSIRALDALSTALSTLALPTRSPRLRFALAALALVFVLGASTSYAAQASLPGDLLYPVKVNVTEPIQGAFALSPQAKANWNANLAATRLSEAETLAAQGKLTSADESAIASGLDQATENFDVNVAALSDSSSSAPVVVDLESNMQATLAAHGEVLQEIANALPRTKQMIAPLIARVQTRALALGNARVAFTNLTVSASSTASVKAAAEGERGSAEGMLSAAQALLGNASATSSAGVASETFDAEQDIGAGDVRLQSGEYGAALQTFQTASLEAQEAQLHVDIADQLQQTTGISLSGATSSVAAAISASTSTAPSTSTSTAATSSDATTSVPDGYGAGPHVGI